ncbi:MAG TPA: SDR family oxidoreductase [Solirubrobacterales bacterium]
MASVSYDFSDEVVMITGAARGQGRSHALNFAKAGATVVISDIAEQMATVAYDLSTSDELNDVAAEIESLGGRCQAAVCDVRDSRQVETMVADGLAEFGKIDVLINNAGVEGLPSVAEMTEEEWDEMLDVLLKGCFLCSKAASANMIERGKGRIITTGSTFAVVASPRQAHYCAGKHGIVGFSKALALELAEHGITVNVVSPGGVDTAMVEGFSVMPQAEWAQQLPGIVGQLNMFDPEALLDPQEVSNVMMWLASDGARFVTGANILVDAGYTIK